MKKLAKSERELAAFDALRKIKDVLAAAQWLTANDNESDLSLELIGIAEDVATRVLEASK